MYILCDICSKLDVYTVLYAPQHASRPEGSAAAPGCLAAETLWIWEPCRKRTRWWTTPDAAMTGRRTISQPSSTSVCRPAHLLQTWVNSSCGVTTPFLDSWISLSSPHIARVRDPGWDSCTVTGSCNQNTNKPLMNKSCNSGKIHLLF